MESRGVSLIAGSAHPALAESIAKNLGLALTPVDIERGRLHGRGILVPAH